MLELRSSDLLGADFLVHRNGKSFAVWHQSGRGLKATQAKEPIAQQSDITSHSRNSPHPICIAMASIFLDSRQVRTTATDVTSRTISFARFYSRHLHRFINVPDDESRTRPRV
jgi:hypothetical protein